MKREELIKNIKEKKSFLCVGLDPDLEKMPEKFRNRKNGIFEFNKAIIDATAPHCIAYKPNAAFYECYGVEGFKAFEDTIRYIKENYPDQFVIADAKRGDIGNTSRMYAKAFFDHLDVDALTVAPYMGEDSVTPFLGFEGKWVVLLALTSNKGSKDFQMLKDASGNCIFEDVINTSQQWGDDRNLMFVVGATQGEYFKKVRELAPKQFLLVPGVGAQGGSFDDVVRNGMNDDCGLLINSSRGIIYASKDDDFAEKAAQEAAKLALQMADSLKARGIIL